VKKNKMKVFVYFLNRHHIDCTKDFSKAELMSKLRLFVLDVLKARACKKGTQRSKHFWNPPLSAPQPPAPRSAHAPSFYVTSAHRSIPAHLFFGPLCSTYLLWLDILHRHHVEYAPRNWPIF
jgi:hypothetical protein